MTDTTESLDGWIFPQIFHMTLPVAFHILYTIIFQVINKYIATVFIVCIYIMFTNKLLYRWCNIQILNPLSTAEHHIKWETYKDKYIKTWNDTALTTVSSISHTLTFFLSFFLKQMWVCFILGKHINSRSTECESFSSTMTNPNLCSLVSYKLSFH